MIISKLLNRPDDTKPSSLLRGGIIPARTAGVIVDEDTALTYSAVYLAVKIISETLAALPSNVYTRVSGSNDRDIARNHPLAVLMNQPNPEMTGFNFKRTIISHAALRGNGYAFIGRDRSNRPGELQLITPDRVNKGRERDSKKIIYEISNGGGANDYTAEADMFHLPGMGFDGLIGYSIVSLAKRSFALGMAAEQFGTSFYENGAQLGTIIEVPPEILLDEDGKEMLLDTFDAKHRGVKHHHRTALIDQGMKVHSLGIPQKDAQFIESRKFNVTDVARWFNIPPHKLKDLEKATFSNIEEQNIDFVQDTMMPWIINFEQTANWKLIGRNNTRQFLKLNLNGLLRGDTEARGKWYKERFNMGSLSINELRALEDENGIGPDGDKYFMQMNMSTIDDIIEPPDPPAPAANPFDKVAAPDDDGEDPEPDGAVNFARFKPLIDDAMGKIVNSVNDHMARKHKPDEENQIDCLRRVVLDRRDYIRANIEPLALAIANGKPFDMDLIIHEVSESIIENNIDDVADMKMNMISDFQQYCATITKTTGDKA